MASAHPFLCQPDYKLPRASLSLCFHIWTVPSSIIPLPADATIIKVNKYSCKPQTGYTKCWELLSGFWSQFCFFKLLNENSVIFKDTSNIYGKLIQVSYTLLSFPPSYTESSSINFIRCMPRHTTGVICKLLSIRNSQLYHLLSCFPQFFRDSKSMPTEKPKSVLLPILSIFSKVYHQEVFSVSCSHECDFANNHGSGH